MEQPFVETAVDLLYCFRVVMLFFREIYQLCCETNCYFHEPRKQLAFAPSTQHEPKIPYTKIPSLDNYLVSLFTLPKFSICHSEAGCAVFISCDIKIRLPNHGHLDVFGYGKYAIVPFWCAKADFATFSSLSDSFSLTMNILAEIRLAKIRTMARPTWSSLSKRHDKKLEWNTFSLSWPFILCIGAFTTWKLPSSPEKKERSTASVL